MRSTRLDVLVTDAYTPDWAMNLFGSAALESGSHVVGRPGYPVGASGRDSNQRFPCSMGYLMDTRSTTGLGAGLLR